MSKRTVFIHLFTVLLLSVITAGSASATQESATPAATPSAGEALVVWFSIQNYGCMPDRLLYATTEVADNADAYRSRDGDSIEDASYLEKGIDLPAGALTKLDPEGYFLLLTGLSQTLSPGDVFVMTLTFGFGIDMDILVTVQDSGQAAGTPMPAAPVSIDSIRVTDSWAMNTQEVPDEQPDR